jgi:hypothetical protein
MLITHPSQVTPDWLSEVLQRSGVLTNGRVERIPHGDMVTGVGGESACGSFAVRYSPDAPETAPRHFFLKFGDRKPEVDFYNHLAPTLTSMPILRCFDAVYKEGRSHLLFEALQTTHGELQDGLPPTVAMTKHMIDIILPLHVHFWENPKLQNEYEPYLDDVPGFILGQAQQHFGRFVDVMGDRLPPNFRRIYEKLLAAMPLPEWQARIDNNHMMTLVHGDPHPHNFLFPYDGNGEIYLIDWAVWHRQLGTFDIFYMMDGHSGRRELVEEPLVRYYHDQLLAQGISGYDWQQCWHDYKLSIISFLPFNIFWFAHGTPPQVWYNGLYDSVNAFIALGCEELLR